MSPPRLTTTIRSTFVCVWAMRTSGRARRSSARSSSRDRTRSSTTRICSMRAAAIYWGCGLSSACFRISCSTESCRWYCVTRATTSSTSRWARAASIPGRGRPPTASTDRIHPRWRMASCPRPATTRPCRHRPRRSGSPPLPIWCFEASHAGEVASMRSIPSTSASPGPRSARSAMTPSPPGSSISRGRFRSVTL